jgi:hypothetical protein
MKKITSVSIALLATGALVAACGGKSEPAAAAPEPTAAPAAAPAPADATAAPAADAAAPAAAGASKNASEGGGDKL